MLFGDLGKELDGSITPLTELQESVIPLELKLITAMIDITVNALKDD